MESKDTSVSFDKVTSSGNYVAGKSRPRTYTSVVFSQIEIDKQKKGYSPSSECNVLAECYAACIHTVQKLFASTLNDPRISWIYGSVPREHSKICSKYQNTGTYPLRENISSYKGTIVRVKI